MYQNPIQRWWRPLIGLVAVILLVLVSWGLYHASTFHIIKTDPNMAAVSKFSPFIKVYYSKPLNADSLRLSDYGGVLSKHAVNGKVLTLTFARQLTIGKQYTVIINRISDTSGEQIINQRLTFTAQNIAINQLSKDQQSYIVANQDKVTYSVYSVTYPGFDELINQGLTGGQVQDIKTALFNYSQQVHQQFWTMNLDTASLNVVFQDPTSREALDSSATFTVVLNTEHYRVRAEYNSYDDNTYTRIYDPSGALVFDNTAAN